MKILKAIFAVLIAAAVLITPQSNAGEVIDYLPEVLLARSLDAHNILALTTSEDLYDVCFDSDPGPDVPDHILIDENGLYRTEEEILQVLVAVECQRAFFDFGQLNPLPTLLGESFETTVLVRSDGEITSLPRLLDGNKQPNRVAASLYWYSFFAKLREITAPPFDSLPNLLPDNPCATFRDWVLNAPTLELQWVAFQVLTFDQISLGGDLSYVGKPDRVCTIEMQGSLEELRALAEGGDLDAAFALGWMWRGMAWRLIGSQEEFDGTEQAEFIDAQIEEFELLVLENTARYPLITLAAVYALEGLYLADRLFHGEAE